MTSKLIIYSRIVKHLIDSIITGHRRIQDPFKDLQRKFLQKFFSRLIYSHQLFSQQVSAISYQRICAEV